MINYLFLSLYIININSYIKCMSTSWDFDPSLKYLIIYWEIKSENRMESRQVQYHEVTDGSDISDIG